MGKKENPSRNYFTTLELAEAAMAQAKADPMWKAMEEACPLDYAHPTTFCRTEKNQVKSCAFDTVGYAYFGSNEGIYASVILRMSTEVALYLVVMKTLSTNKDAFMAMQQLAGLVAYHLRQIVDKNLDRFD